MNKNIAIDGPAGAGKSTIAKMIAKKLGLVYVDTGAMYRGLAIHFLRCGLSPDDEAGISEAVKDAEVSIAYEDGTMQVYLNGENVTAHLREEATGNMASASSVFKAVRDRLLDLQRELARKTDVVMDGRDIGTVVLPDAMLKVFLTASVEERTRRRVLELREKGQEVDEAKIMEDIKERDYRDSHRPIAPLKLADDGVLVDSSDLSIDEVVNTITKLYEDKIALQ